VKRRQRGHETLGQFALSMRLLVGKALRRMGRLEEAELAFKVLAGAHAAPSQAAQLLVWVSRVLTSFGPTAASRNRQAFDGSHAL
jgi:hypothetical protein